MKRSTFALLMSGLLLSSSGCTSFMPSTFSSRSVGNQVVVDASGRAAENAALSNQSSVTMGSRGQTASPYSVNLSSDAYIDSYTSPYLNSYIDSYTNQYSDQYINQYTNPYEQMLQRSMSNILENAVQSIEF